MGAVSFGGVGIDKAAVVGVAALDLVALTVINEKSLGGVGNESSIGWKVFDVVNAGWVVAGSLFYPKRFGELFGAEVNAEEGEDKVAAALEKDGAVPVFFGGNDPVLDVVGFIYGFSKVPFALGVFSPPPAWLPLQGLVGRQSLPLCCDVGGAYAERALIYSRRVGDFMVLR